MAAGLGFKDFVTGEVLTAADVDGYLMQNIWVFANATARDAAVTSPQEGNACYLKDTDAVMTYSGSAWVAVGGGTSPINPNLVINGNFTINQRSYVSGANLASGSYGFDRWKSNFTNTTLTFTSAPAGQSVTINSGGGLQQIVEQANVPAGTYVLSFTGTATGRIYNSGATPPSYAASPISFTADGLANVVVEFTASGSTKTLSKVKLESGATATTYSYAGGTIQGELLACQRYYFRIKAQASANNFGPGLADFTTGALFSYTYPTTLRTSPTALETSGTVGDYTIRYAGGATTAATVINFGSSGLNTANIEITCASVLTAGQAVAGRFQGTNGYFGWSAEL